MIFTIFAILTTVYVLFKMYIINIQRLIDNGYLVSSRFLMTLPDASLVKYNPDELPIYDNPNNDLQLRILDIYAPALITHDIVTDGLNITKSRDIIRLLRNYSTRNFVYELHTFDNISQEFINDLLKSHWSIKYKFISLPELDLTEMFKLIPHKLQLVFDETSSIDIYNEMKTKYNFIETNALKNQLKKRFSNDTHTDF